MLRSFVVEGLYPKQLLEEWDRYEEEHGTESVRPGKLQKCRELSS